MNNDEWAKFIGLNTISTVLFGLTALVFSSLGFEVAKIIFVALCCLGALAGIFGILKLKVPK